MRPDLASRHSDGKNVRITSFIAILSKKTGKRIVGGKSNNVRHDKEYLNYECTRQDDVITLFIKPRENVNAIVHEKNTVKKSLSLILGDDHEWVDTHGEKCMASGAFIELDFCENQLTILSSIVALPPIFIYKGLNETIVTSDIYLLKENSSERLYFNPEGITEFCVIGHPIGHKTLFKNCHIMPAGSKLTINNSKDYDLNRIWHLPQKEPFDNWTKFTDRQIDLFTEAMHNLDLSESFLSLTAGLDTRTILAYIVKNQIKIPGYTITGKNLTLDARIARMLSDKYDFRHNTVIVDESFYKELPEYTLEASRLSGGLASIGQATEVYFYKSVNGDFKARLSGNLGNQVGRGGTEKITLRNADITILNDQIVNGRKEAPTTHWYENQVKEDGGLNYEFLMQNEIPFSSVGNYCIGNHYVTQQTPYSNNQLIELSSRYPRQKKQSASLSVNVMRLKDLKHRFLGEPEINSFQRKMINQAGGYVSTCPINWGWRAKGGVSVNGIFMGGLTLFDAYRHKKGIDSGFIGKGLQAMRIMGLHEFRNYSRWINTLLNDFIYDNLNSVSARESGLFNNKRINQLFDNKHNIRKPGANAMERDLIAALDLALAQKSFGATIG